MEIKILNIESIKELNGFVDVCYSIEFNLTKSKTVGSGDDIKVLEGSIVEKRPLGAPDVDSYVKYDDVTEEIAKEWVIESLGGYYDKYEAKLDAQIESQVNQSNVKKEKVPWLKYPSNLWGLAQLHQYCDDNDIEYCPEAIEAVEAQDAVLDEDGEEVSPAVEAVEAQDADTKASLLAAIDEASEE